jgi:hypothetical protein
MRLVAGFPRRRTFDPRSDHVGYVVDKVALGQVFSEYFGFPWQFSFHRLLHIHHLSSGAGTIGQLVADVPSGLSLTPPQETKKSQLHELSPSWEAASRSLLKNSLTFHGTRMFIAVFTRAHHWYLLNQINPVHTAPSYLPKIHFNIIFPPTSMFS